MNSFMSNIGYRVEYFLLLNDIAAHPSLVEEIRGTLLSSPTILAATCRDTCVLVLRFTSTCSHLHTRQFMGLMGRGSKNTYDNFYSSSDGMLKDAELIQVEKERFTVRFGFWNFSSGEPGISTFSRLPVLIINLSGMSGIGLSEVKTQGIDLPELEPKRYDAEGMEL